MAINQSHIIDLIPQLMKDEYFHQLLALRTLAGVGWGVNSKLYLLVDGIIEMHNDCEESEFVIFDANFTFPDLWKCPRGGFRHVEFDFDVKSNKFLDPEAENRKN